MKILTSDEVNFISGGDLDKCNINDLSKEVLRGAINMAAGSMAVSSIVIPGIGPVPGWFAAAVAGGGLDCLIYSVTCWW